MAGKLGRIEKVELRSIWTNEGLHFTPWLAQEENLELLGEALGIDLELEAQEKDVGPFRADLLCKNTAEQNSWVVIENQLERTDHRHLGQLLTYAAGLGATTIVWVSSQLLEEHRAALDWMNRITVESVRFFGVEVELWRIGSSEPAPRFNVVCKPNDWASDVRRSADALDETPNRSQQLRLRYWSAFREYLQANKSRLRPQKPGQGFSYNFGIGTSRAHIAASLVTRENLIGVELSITAPDAKQLFKALEERRASIEHAIGSKLDWRELPDQKLSRVLLTCQADAFDEAGWPTQFAWLRQTLETFDLVFRPLVARQAH
jgi:hypothetical protein